MSRADAATPGVLTTTHDAFVTWVTGSDGKTSSVTSSQELSPESRIIDTHQNESSFATLAAFLHFTENGGHGEEWVLKLPMICMNMFAVMPGFVRDSHNNNAVSISRFPLFKMINSHHVSTILDAVMRGEEVIAMHAIAENPEALLETRNVKNSVDRTHVVTPLQAAIMANDIQMAEKMKAHFERLSGGLAEMHRQIKGIYLKSLRSLQPDTKMSESDDISVIIEAHNKAQEANAFDFKPYVDAICAINLNDSIQTAQLDAVMALINAKPEDTAKIAADTGVSATQTPEARGKSFDELTLVEKLNRFREEFVLHMQKETIFNPHHILAGLEINVATWNTLSHAADPAYKKRDIIFSQLVGWAQRKAAEPVKQDIRQGTFYLTDGKELRSRPSRFNDLDSNYCYIVRNSFVDATLVNSSSFDSLGFQVASRHAPSNAQWMWSRLAVRWPSSAAQIARLFKTYVEQKNSKLGELMQPQRRAHTQPGRGCVVA